LSGRRTTSSSGQVSSDQAVVVDVLRTPFGRRGGALSSWHPVDLAAELLAQLVARNGLDGAAIDDVILGCTSQVGAQASNIARRAVLAAGWSENVPGATVDRHAASAAQAIHWAAQAVTSGAQGLVIAGGIEVMTAVPLGASLAVPAVGKPYGQRLQARYKEAGARESGTKESGAKDAGGKEARGLIPPGLVAEELAARWSLKRAELDEWALTSRERAQQAQRSPLRYVAPVAVPGHKPLAKDEAVAQKLSAAKVAALSPAYKPDGVVTAANIVAEGDGACAVLIASPGRARELSLAAKARFVSFATAGTSPELWPMASVPAARDALTKAGLGIDDIDRWEIYESSSAAMLAWLAETGVVPGKVNPDGGALATTAPLGAIGAAGFAAAVEAISQGGVRRALVSVAGDPGVATACVLERL
jgi:acetyl-CoA acetyltransferase family protein